LEEEVTRLKRTKTRRDLNRRFMALSEILVKDEAIAKVEDQGKGVVVDSGSEDEEEEAASEAEVKASTAEFPQRTTRYGRLIKRHRYE
jgi:hypothetical protein